MQRATTCSCAGQLKVARGCHLATGACSWYLACPCSVVAFKVLRKVLKIVCRRTAPAAGTRTALFGPVMMPQGLPPHYQRILAENISPVCGKKKRSPPCLPKALGVRVSNQEDDNLQRGGKSSMINQGIENAIVAVLAQFCGSDSLKGRALYYNIVATIRMPMCPNRNSKQIHLHHPRYDIAPSSRLNSFSAHPLQEFSCRRRRVNLLSVPSIHEEFLKVGIDTEFSNLEGCKALKTCIAYGKIWCN